MKHQNKISDFNHNLILFQRVRGENRNIEKQRHEKKGNLTLSKVLNQIFATNQNSADWNYGYYLLKGTPRSISVATWLYPKNHPTRLL